MQGQAIFFDATLLFSISTFFAFYALFWTAIYSCFALKICRQVRELRFTFYDSITNNATAADMFVCGYPSSSSRRRYGMNGNSGSCCQPN